MIPFLRKPWLVILLASVLIGAALLHPRLTLPRAGFDGFVVFDVTQSMDVEDMKLQRADVSRLEFAKQAVLEALPDLPCGARVGIGIFTEYRTLTIINPVEVCDGLNELQSVVRSVNGRMGWAGNSEVAKGLFWAMRLATKAGDSVENRPAVVFITDGQEAPPVNANNRLVYQGKAGDVRGIVVGVGGDTLLPIPKRAPDGKLIGMWDAAEVAQVNPYAKNYTDDGTHQSNRTTGSEGAVSTQRSASGDMQATPGTEHLSSLRERYLQLLARETGLAYQRARVTRDIRDALSVTTLASSHRQPTDLAPILTALALLCWIGVYAVAGARGSLPERSRGANAGAAAD